MYGAYSVTLGQRSDIQEGQASKEKEMNIQRQDSFSLLHGVGALNLFSLLVFCISVMAFPCEKIFNAPVLGLEEDLGRDLALDNAAEKAGRVGGHCRIRICVYVCVCVNETK